MDRVDFEPREAIPHSGWPFTREHLDPYYRRAESLLGIFHEGEVREEQAVGQPLHFLDGQVRTVPVQIAGRDPFALDAARWLRASSAISAFLYATALEIETDETARTATAVRVATPNGRVFRVSARQFVVAVGGIEVPRLLLLSNSRAPAGLGNAHDLVGRFFMEHPHFSLNVVVADPRVAAGFVYYQIPHSGRRVHPMLALTEDVVRREGLLNGCAHLIPERPRRRRLPAATLARRHFAEALRGDAPRRDLLTSFPALAVDWGAAIVYRAALLRFRLGTLFHPITRYRLQHMTEQAPHPDSRVTLTRDRDRFGQNRVRLDWRLQRRDLEDVARMHGILHRSLVASGLGQLETSSYPEVPDPPMRGGYHHMGTTRMHADPRLGVVDPDCRLHTMHNVYVASSAVFPTGGFANPTLTIVALAIRLGDHLKRHLAEGR